MKKRKHARWVLLLVLAAIFASAAAAGAQSGGGYDLGWNTIDGGGAMFSTGGGYSLGGAIRRIARRRRLCAQRRILERSTRVWTVPAHGCEIALLLLARTQAW